jgi:hypothetical protein
VHAVDFSCPGCGERLRLQLASEGEKLVASLAALILAFVAAYLVGSHWLPVWLLGLILWFPIACVLGLLKGYCFPLRITRSYGPLPSEPVGNILHIGRSVDSGKGERGGT